MILLKRQRKFAGNVMIGHNYQQKCFIVRLIVLCRNILKDDEEKDGTWINIDGFKLAFKDRYDLLAGK